MPEVLADGSVTHNCFMLLLFATMLSPWLGLLRQQTTGACAGVPHDGWHAYGPLNLPSYGPTHLSISMSHKFSFPERLSTSFRSTDIVFGHLNTVWAPNLRFVQPLVYSSSSQYDENGPALTKSAAVSSPLSGPRNE